MDYQDDGVSVNRLIDVAIERAELKYPGQTHQFDVAHYNEHLGRWLVAAFKEQYRDGVLDLDKDVDAAAREELGELLRGDQ